MVLLKTLVTYILLHATFFSLAQEWSYATLSEPKGVIDMGSLGNKLFFYSGVKSVGNTSVYTNEVEIIDILSGNKEVFTLTPEQVRRDMAIASSGSRIYFAGGFYSSLGVPGVYFKRVDIYDTLSKEWLIDELSQPRNFFAAAAANSKVLFGGGFGTNEPNSVSKIVDIYDQTSETWQQYLLPSNPVGNGGSARQDLAIATVGNKILFAGGYASTVYRDMVNIYDSEQDTWLPNAALSQKKSRLKSVTFNNKVFFAGGVLKSSIPSDTIDIYDNASDTWSVMKIPHLFKKVKTGANRPYRQAAQAGCKMFLVPVGDGSTSVPYVASESSRDSIAVYDFARDTWSYLGLPQAVYGTGVIAAKNKVYFAGGLDVATGHYTDLISILTLEPQLKSEIDDISVNNYDYGGLLLGEQHAITINFTNDGDYELLFENLSSRISIMGDHEDFTVDYSSLQLVDTLAPAKSISIPVTFHPSSLGTKQISLVIRSNDPHQSHYTFTIQGTGTDVTTVSDTEAINGLHVFPNPTSGLLNVRSNKGRENLQVDVLNIQGFSVMGTQNITNDQFIDLSSLTQGLYFVKIANDHSHSVFKVLKK